MVNDAPGDPPRLALQEILYDEQSQLDHAHDVLHKCRRIMEIAKADIDEGIFLYGSDVRPTLDAIMTEARKTLLY